MIKAIFIHQPLPYNETYLGPYMDAETLQLHHKFHHGGAVTAANKDLQMIKKAVGESNMETVDFGQKNYPITFHLTSCIQSFGPTLPTKRIYQRVNY